VLSKDWGEYNEGWMEEVQSHRMAGETSYGILWYN
jgi:hypothetical protein